MRQTRTLFVLAGYPDEINRPVADLQARLREEGCDFIGRTYPERPDKRATYVRDVGSSIVRYIFGDAATGFCRQVDQPCAHEAAERHGRTCKQSDGRACYRARPRLLVIVCHPRVHQEMLERLGRAALLLVHEAASVADTTTLQARLRAELPALRSIQQYLDNLPKDRLAPLLPLRNFQQLGNHAITVEAQCDLTSFRDVMETYHRQLHDRTFRNARKGYMRGAYRLGGHIGFQRDRLHGAPAQIGEESRADVFHLVNAFYLYGAATLPNMHFDVVGEDDAALGVSFRDILTEAQSPLSARHVNVTPCDRVL